MSERRHVVLIVEDDAEYRALLERALSAGYDTVGVASVDAARRRLDQGVSAVLLDIRLDGEDDSNREGLTLLREITEKHPRLPVIMMTGYADIDVAVQAMKGGASDFIQKASFDLRELDKVVGLSIERSELSRRVEDLEGQLRRLEPWELIGDSEGMERLRGQIDLVARDGFGDVLVTGETGTGKELVARSIHARGRRRSGPFVAVTISALSPDVVESELFGHAKGAFTGAYESRVGYFEKADGGVLFLDEIGELSPALQVKLLRVLETRSFARVGSTTEVSVDVQVVVATNRDLQEGVAEGLIRQDFFYRINNSVVHVPPLRERTDDIPLLVDFFLFKFREQGRTQLAGIAPDALKALAGYGFPGNVRELRSLVERAMMLAMNRGAKLIDTCDIPLSAEPHPGTGPHARATAGKGLDERLAACELDMIETALREAQGKKEDAWRGLGLNDRFALRRRVLSLTSKYPGLVRPGGYVDQLYRRSEP